MTTTVALFDSMNLRDLWFDADGLLRAYQKATKMAAKPRRKITFKAIVGASLIAATTAALAKTPPGQAIVTWLSAPSEASIRKSLEQSLQNLRRLKAHWNGIEAPAPIERSISAAQYILPQLPALHGDATAGVDSEGHVFLKFARGDRVAFLTVEPRVMHVVYMQPGQATVYEDDEQFNGKVLPENIKKVLSKLA